MVDITNIADKHGWVSVKDAFPPFEVEVEVGCWYKDPWLIEELAWRWLSGRAQYIDEKSRSFPLGRWASMGWSGSHNDITHWRYIQAPERN